MSKDESDDNKSPRGVHGDCIQVSVTALTCAGHDSQKPVPFCRTRSHPSCEGLAACFATVASQWNLCEWCLVEMNVENLTC